MFTLHQYHLQVIEALHCLKGMGPTDLEELVVTQGGLLLLTSQGMSIILPVFITLYINYFYKRYKHCFVLHIFLHKEFSCLYFKIFEVVCYEFS